ncbi:MAG: GxxExxY protein [Bacteroidetes bacterium]|nr:GxxExxY protein [Bacteroidota bacterium]
MKITQKHINDLSYKIVGCAIEVHKNLGPGLLEGIYEHCLMKELRDAGLDARNQEIVSIRYKDEKLDIPLRLDILVNDLIIIELKAIESVLPVHKAQLLSYLKLTNKPKGLLINFNSTNITKDLIPLVTEEFSKLPLE